MAKLGVVLGNTHIQWAKWRDDKWQHPQKAQHSQWHSLLADLDPAVSHVLLAGVVPDLCAEIYQYLTTATPLTVKICQLADLPLHDCYATMGIDRALCAVGAIRLFGCPVLVIDAGTAISITAIAEGHTFWGGAIMPGLRMQLSSLAQGTAVLPHLSLRERLNDPPQLWARNTPDSIYSGVIHGVIAGLEKYITAWRRDFPSGSVVITGGDGNILQAHLGISYVPDLIFRGLEVLC